MRKLYCDRCEHWCGANNENDTGRCAPFYTYLTRQDLDSDGDNVNYNIPEESSIKCGACDNETSWHDRNDPGNEEAQETPQAPYSARPVFLSPL